MILGIRPACALILALSLGACATVVPTHVALAPNAREAIPSTEVVAPIRQSEIYIYVPPTTAGQANGLIGALFDAGVDSYRAGTAETAIKPLRNTVVDMNFDSDLQNQLRTSLSQIGWLHLDHVRVIKDGAVKSVDQAIAASKDGAVMIANADYHFSNDGSQLFVIINLDLYANSASLAPFKPAGGKVEIMSDSSNSLYRNSFMFQSKLQSVSSKRDVNMASWSANNGAAFRAAMKLSVVKLGGMIALDVQADPAVVTAAPATGNMPIGHDPDGVLVRQPDGSLVFTANSTVQ